MRASRLDSNENSEQSRDKCRSSVSFDMEWARIKGWLMEHWTSSRVRSEGKRRWSFSQNPWVRRVMRPDNRKWSTCFDTFCKPFKTDSVKSCTPVISKDRRGPQRRSELCRSFPVIWYPSACSLKVTCFICFQIEEYQTLEVNWALRKPEWKCLES